MELQHIKMVVSGLWVATAVLLAIVVDPARAGQITIAALGLLPPLALMLLWNDPAQTMSERIRAVTRKS